MPSALGALCSVSPLALCVRMGPEGLEGLPKRMLHRQLSLPCPRDHTSLVEGREQLFSLSHKQQHIKTPSGKGGQTCPRRLLPTVLTTFITYLSPETQWHQIGRAHV